ncbi:MAG TPA: S8 family serine peptidase [Thermoanaerobaculaceae bacterium]|nr:S8 family serine peptidase [Thermoanaerobaculaceae bacterium]
MALGTLLLGALVGAAPLPAVDQTAGAAGDLSAAQLQLPPDNRSWAEKVSPVVLDRATQGKPTQQLLVTFRVPEAVRQLGLRAPGAPGRTHWIADTADGLVRDFAPFGVVELRRYRHLSAVFASVPADAIPALAGDARVDALSPDRAVRKLDAQGNNYIHVPTIQPPHSGAGVGVAIMDTGVDYTQQDVGPAGTKTIKLFDDYRSSSDPNYALDDEGHGTEVAGVAAGTGAGNANAAGVAPAATIVAVKILDSTGNGDTNSILAGIDAVLTSVAGGNPYNIRAANFSLGGYFTDQGSGAAAVPPQPCDDPTDPTVDAFRQLVAAGVVVAVASGNGACTTGVSWPACISSALAVGAVYDTGGSGFSFPGALQCGAASGCKDLMLGIGKVACFSDSGPKLDVWAPTCVAAPMKGGGYDSSFCGTSASAPFVAGLAALLAEAKPGFSGAIIASAMRNNGQPITDARNGVTRNLVLADQALAGVVCSAPAVPSDAASDKSSVCTGQQFVVSWTAVSGASSYTVQLSTDPGFASPTSTDVVVPSYSYSTTQSTAADFYVRVRSNASCGMSSSFSTPVVVTYDPVCQVAYTHTYFVPGIARLPGFAPAFWYTDLAAFNASGSLANIRLTFFGTATPAPVVTTLANLQQMTWPDVLASVFADNGPDKGVILVDSDEPIQVLSRTYSKVTTNGTTQTFGQSYTGLEAGGGVAGGSVGYLVNLRSDGSFRTNVEIANVGEVTTDVEVRFFSNAGALITTATASALAPQRWTQLVRALPAGQSAAYAEVRPLAVGAVVVSVADVVDGSSTDPTTIPLYVP